MPLGQAWVSLYLRIGGGGACIKARFGWVVYLDESMSSDEEGEIDLLSNREGWLEDEDATVPIDGTMGVSRPQDRFLQYLYDIILHKYGRVIPTARENGGGIEMYIKYGRHEQVVEIHKTKREADVYKVTIPRCLLRRLEVTGRNRVYVNTHQDDYFDAPAQDRDHFTQVLRIRCTPADFNWLTGAGQQPVLRADIGAEAGQRADIRAEVGKLWSLLNSLYDWSTVH